MEQVQKVHRMNSEQFERFIETEIFTRIHAVENTTHTHEHEPEPSLNISNIKKRYPHLQELCNYFERSAALSTLREDKKFTLPSPVILLGKPGTGKTDFCFFVAAQLHAEAHLFDCSCSSASFLLTGMSSTWRGAKRGLIYELVHGENTHAKPFLILDEIEKSNPNTQHPIMPALGNLFEPVTASKFCDEFSGEHANANEINFICTANNLETIPEYILNRCEIIECPNPTREQQMNVIKSLWNDLKCDIFADDFSLSPGALELCSNLGLRAVKRALTHAVALAVLNKKTVVSEIEIKHAIASSNSSKAARIGFIQ
ncbi:AAA family ATPase [Mariprofundus ferrooxydans]|nr:AAA family ATPase [Mariprofundus ferrooxydans]